jgi:hypothetical protein
MPVLANQREERFCQFVVAGNSIVEAYEKAGYRPSTSNASRMRANPRVDERIRELLTEIASKTVENTQEVSLNSLMREFEEARQVALAAKDARGMAIASQSKAKLAGLWQEASTQVKINLDVTNTRSSELTAALLDRMLKGDLSPQELEAAANGRLLSGPVIDQ